MFGLNYLRDVTTLALDSGRCTGCRTCTTVCPHGVFEVSERKAHIVARDACMECGACARNCPEGALAVEAGVGCAAALINASLTGGEACCGPAEGGGSGCC
jgi:NAD-dependent dihydropyrimidine dehydrogenase PreA subunit